MSVEPDTPDEWLTLTVGGYKMDVDPDESDAGRVLSAVRDGRNRDKKRYRHISPHNCILVREADVETDENGDPMDPPNDEARVSADLSGVEDGDLLHIYMLKVSDRPAYPELADGSGGDDK